MQEAREVGEFEEMLAKWVGCCAVCMGQGVSEVYHQMEGCPDREKQVWKGTQWGIERVTEEMIAKRRFGPYSACFGCGLPQAICQQWKAASNDGRLFRRVPGKKYQYPEVLFHIFVAQRVRALE